MDGHLTFKNHHNGCMQKARAVESSVRTLPKTYGVVPKSGRAPHVAGVQVIAQYDRELCWDPKNVGSRDDLQLLLNRQT